MQFSESWLRSLCNPPLDTESLCHVLTMAGLEVEDIQPVAAAFSHVVVAQILSAESIPTPTSSNCVRSTRVRARHCRSFVVRRMPLSA
jgi:phenylalanyl-tRNA synthetase beta chain